MLAESLDLQATLNRLLALIVPEFGDWAAIDLFDENDRVQTVAVIHADASKTRLVERLQKSRAVIRELGPRAAVTVPLRTRRRTIGSLVVCWSETPRRYDEEDKSLFEALTKPAALSIENARLLERERAIAAEFQRAALPIALPEIAGIRFSGIYVPANDRESLGGDWYDALRLGDGRVVVSIGDVAGSGLAAAVIMSSMRQVIRGVAQSSCRPHCDVGRCRSHAENRAPGHTRVGICRRIRSRRADADLCLRRTPVPVTSGRLRRGDGARHERTSARSPRP